MNVHINNDHLTPAILWKQVYNKRFSEPGWKYLPWMIATTVNLDVNARYYAIANKVSNSIILWHIFTVELQTNGADSLIVRCYELKENFLTQNANFETLHIWTYPVTDQNYRVYHKYQLEQIKC